MNFLLEQLPDASFRRHLEQLLNLLSLPGVTDVICNGPADWWVDRGKGLESVPELQVPARELQEMARFLAALGDRHLDLISPIADAAVTVANFPVLKQLGIDRLRLHAVLESEVSEQTLLSIRVHRETTAKLTVLFNEGMFTAAQLLQLQEILRTRANFVISGPTGSGKTTLLRAMLAQNEQLRTVVVEDTFEILPIPGQVVGLQVRHPNTDGAGGIDLATLAREALRMRPDRLVIGEVRGPEVAVLLKAMNTGHAGSASTIHANSAGQVYARLLALATDAGFTQQIFTPMVKAAVEWVIHLDIEGSERKIKEIGKLQNVPGAK
jgi:pilus assembly protein CpaF